MTYLDFLKSPGRYDLTSKVIVTYYSLYPDTDPDAPESADRRGVLMTLPGIVARCADYEDVTMNEISAACQLIRAWRAAPTMPLNPTEVWNVLSDANGNSIGLVTPKGELVPEWMLKHD